MLRAVLSGCVQGLRVAGAREPEALFTARTGPDAALPALAGLGLRAEVRGQVLVILPTRALAEALAARGARWAGGACAGECARCTDNCAARALPRLSEAYGAPAPAYQARALVRELSALARGWNEDDMALVARGLRLIEGPCDAIQRRTYARDVRRSAALALRTGAPGDGLRACAYIMALGGIVI